MAALWMSAVLVSVLGSCRDAATVSPIERPLCASLAAQLRDADGEALLGALASRTPTGSGGGDSTLACLDGRSVLLAAHALERRTRELRLENSSLRADLAAARETDAALRRDVAALWSELAQLRPSSSRSVPRH